MTEGEVSSVNEDIKENNKDVFSDQEISEYVNGCETLGLAIEDAVDRIQQAGKKPTILIPSRGAVPIFILAMNSLREGNSKSDLVNPEKTKYFPKKIFPYLSNGMIPESQVEDQNEGSVDVVLFPFTADVSDPSSQKQNIFRRIFSEPKKQDEDFAKKLRLSCSVSMTDLFYGQQDSADLNWYFYLLNKIDERVFSSFDSSPQEVADSLKSIKSDSDREIILIDTVISGRAVSNITSAFNLLGHKITPILAVDNTNGGKLRKHYREEIRRNISHDYIQSLDSQLIEFPLISEDRGAALLGISALNVTNFNREKIFYAANTNFPPDYLPQSCLWVIPPKDYYSEIFHAFLERCSKGLSIKNFEQWMIHAEEIKYLVQGKGFELSESVDELIKTENGVESYSESGSHIISVTIPQEEAKNWVEEFSLNYFAPIDNFEDQTPSQ